MNDPLTCFITWTTYGAWLPGDNRGWRKWNSGQQQPRPLLEEWCRDRMSEQPVILDDIQRAKVEDVCRRHAEIRNWQMHAISVRSNHVHIAVTAAAASTKVRDQFEANSTRVLQEEPNPIENKKIWTRGGDIQFIDGGEALEQVIVYITEAQDRMERGK